MSKKEDYQLLQRLLDLRKKEIWEGLSYEDERQLTALTNEIDRVFSKRNPLNTKADQMECSIAVVAVRNPNFERGVLKQTLFEKLMKKEPYIYYDLQMLQEEDLQYDFYTYKFLLSIRDFMNDVGIGNDWIRIAPPTIDMPEALYFRLEKKEMEWIKQLPEPKWCLQMINKVKNIEDKALMQGQEVADFLNWMKNHWEAGYSIYIDYTELQFVEIG